jgi:dTDP-4-dehydrorhamnose 3,5-epimerase
MKWEAKELRAGDNQSIFISEGLGHAFLSLEDETVISYLLSSPYSPSDEHTINPLDQEINIAWPKLPLSFSEKDAAAPSLREFLSSL